jgi:hypothetical protein
MIMTQATGQDIREIKGAIEVIAKGTEANTKAIADLATAFTSLREEVRVGFSELRGDMNSLKQELKGEMKVLGQELKGEIKVIDNRAINLETTAQKLPDLAEKVGELKNWKQLAIVIFTASVSGAIAWFLRSGQS